MADDGELVERVATAMLRVAGSEVVIDGRLITMARAAIAEVQRWRPIETAPRDREILLLWKSGGIGKGRWETDESWEIRNWAHKALPEGWRCDGDACIPVNQADCTHWQPLPAPPQ